MKIPILIEAAGVRFRASTGELFVARAEGDSPEEALELMKRQIEHRVQGARIEMFELPNGENPWLAGAGMLRDEPLFDDWQQAMADYRREANQRADAP